MHVSNSTRRLVILLVAVAAVFIIIAGIQNASKIINPILLAGVITITLLPVPSWFIRRKVPPWLAVVLTILLVVGILVLIGWLTLISVSQIDDRIPEMINSLGIPGISEGAEIPEPGSPEAYITDTLATLRFDRFLEIFGGVLLAIGNSVAQMFLTLLIFVFMLGAALSLRGATLKGIDFTSPVYQSITGLTDNVRKYVVLTTAVNFLVAVGNWLFLLVLGIPYAFLWGVLSFVMGYIPAVGFWIALIPPVILAYGEQGLTTAIIVFVGYVLINGTVENLLKPRIYGKGLKISPLVVFISLVIWAWLLGGIGAILAIPLTLLLLSILEQFESTTWMVSLARLTPSSESSDRELVSRRVRPMLDQAVGFLRRTGFMAAASPSPATAADDGGSSSPGTST
jgi:predicted PurR-regulated permease PerM